MLVQGATALHWKLATLETLVIPVKLARVMSRIWNCELVQLPSPGAPLNRVHCEIEIADPRRPLALRFWKTMSEASTRRWLVRALYFFRPPDLHPRPPPPPLGGYPF